MLALIDADFLLFYCTHQKQGEDTKEFSTICNSANSFLMDIFSRVKATEYLGFFTTPPNFRKELNPKYKANRKSQPLPPYFHELKAWLIEHFNIVTVSQYEADDLVRIYKNHYKTSREIIIVSNDKDIINLEGTTYNPIKKEFKTTNEYEAKIYFWSSMIIGDKGDNISGIEGLGPAAAERLIQKGVDPYHQIVLDSYIEKYGEINGIENFYLNYRSLKILEKPEQIRYYEDSRTPYEQPKFVYQEPITLNNPVNEFQDTELSP